MKNFKSLARKAFAEALSGSFARKFSVVEITSDLSQRSICVSTRNRGADVGLDRSRRVQ